MMVPEGYLVPVGDTAWSEQDRFLLDRARLMIGRGPQCDIQVRLRSVSRLHAEVVWQDGVPYVVQHSTTNPTLVNGMPVSDMAALQTGDVIEIGQGVELRLDLVENEDSIGTEPLAGIGRRLVAILHADAVGYSRLMATNETHAVRMLGICWRIFRIEAQNHGGQMHESGGDCVLILFASVQRAVACAAAIQHQLAVYNQDLSADEQMLFRIGINTGDVIVARDGNHQGDAVNLAARLQAAADPGGVLVSAVVYDQLAGFQDFAFECVGEQQHKNMLRDVRAYKLIG